MTSRDLHPSGGKPTQLSPGFAIHSCRHTFKCNLKISAPKLIALTSKTSHILEPLVLVTDQNNLQFDRTRMQWHRSQPTLPGAPVGPALHGPVGARQHIHVAWFEPLGESHVLHRVLVPAKHQCLVRKPRQRLVDALMHVLLSAVEKRAWPQPRSSHLQCLKYTKKHGEAGGGILIRFQITIPNYYQPSYW